MITLKNSTHIRTNRTVKGFRWCKHNTGVPLAYLDLGRMALEEQRLSQREARRLWLTKAWNKRPVPSCQTRAR